jgi:peptidyl-prolyl cis-trans isomerase C
LNIVASAHGKRYKTRCISVESMPSKIHCAHILVKTESEVKKILDRLGKGDKFASIAKEVSLCPSGKRGGDLGTFGRGQMVKEFETAAFALQKGQISAVVKTKYGYHLIKRLE